MNNRNYQTVNINIFILITMFITLLYYILGLDLIQLINNKNVSNIPTIYKLLIVILDTKLSFCFWTVMLFSVFHNIIGSFVRKIGLTVPLAFTSITVYSTIYLIFACDGFSVLNFYELNTKINVTLYDILLTIHPIIVYFSQSISICLCLIILEMDNSIKENISTKKRRVAHASLFLSFLAIFLGSYWAYHVLGWGGYWFWDPVELLSSIQIILLLGLIHCFKNNTRYFEKKQAIFLLLHVIYSILYVRFFIGNSVHSFATHSQELYNNLSIILLNCFILLLVLKQLPILFTIRNSINNKNYEWISFLFSSVALYTFIYVFFPVSFRTLFSESFILDLDSIVICYSSLFFLLFFSFQKQKDNTVLYLIIVVCFSLYFFIHSFYICVIVSILLYSGTNILRMKRSTRKLHFFIFTLFMSVLLSSVYSFDIVKFITVGSITNNIYGFFLLNLWEFSNQFITETYLPFFSESFNWINSSNITKLYYIYEDTLISESAILSNLIHDININSSIGNSITGWIIKYSKKIYIEIIWFFSVVVLCQTWNTNIRYNIILQNRIQWL